MSETKSLGELMRACVQLGAVVSDAKNSRAETELRELIADRAADKAEIERLRSENVMIQAWRSRCELAEASIAELEADARRWQYLRDSGDDSIYAMRFDVDGDAPITGNDLDVSIDAMISAGKVSTNGQ